MMVLKRELASIQTLERSRTSCTSVPWHTTQARQGSVGVGRGGCREQDSPGGPVHVWDLPAAPWWRKKGIGIKSY